MSIETTVLDFKLSNTFEEYEVTWMLWTTSHVLTDGSKTFYIGKSLEDPKEQPYVPRASKYLLRHLC